MFKFFVVAARLFLVFCVCLSFDDLAKQWHKILWGVSEVGKRFLCYFLSAVHLFLGFFFSLLRSRATKCARHCISLSKNHFFLPKQTLKKVPRMANSYFLCTFYFGL